MPTRNKPAPKLEFPLHDIRCAHCARKLAEGHYTRLSIKCPRCGTLNTFQRGQPPAT